mmetsp:Transcript_118031/g.306466  ORF Transcript_118031/g.306466 Transcript_118031/m.306466 type:complete len:221 (-) Transcript_118031:302-964(-)
MASTTCHPFCSDNSTIDWTSACSHSLCPCSCWFETDGRFECLDPGLDGGLLPAATWLSATGAAGSDGWAQLAKIREANPRTIAGFGRSGGCGSTDSGGKSPSDFVLYLTAVRDCLRGSDTNLADDRTSTRLGSEPYLVESACTVEELEDAARGDACPGAASASPGAPMGNIIAGDLLPLPHSTAREAKTALDTFGFSGVGVAHGGLGSNGHCSGEEQATS